jgi:hypothetical protein
MSTFNYMSAAELFPTRNKRSGRSPFGYKRFDRAADAIRFAVEELPPELLHGAHLEVDEVRFDGPAIRRLYDSPAYPLPRRAAAGSGAANANKSRAAAGSGAANADTNRAAAGSGAANVNKNRAAAGTGAASSTKSRAAGAPGAAAAKAAHAGARNSPAARAKTGS